MAFEPKRDATCTPWVNASWAPSAVVCTAILCEIDTMTAKTASCWHIRACVGLRRGQTSRADVASEARPKHERRSKVVTAANYLGIDFGTSGARICAIDGIILATCTCIAEESSPARQERVYVTFRCSNRGIHVERLALNLSSHEPSPFVPLVPHL